MICTKCGEKIKDGETVYYDSKYTPPKTYHMCCSPLATKPTTEADPTGRTATDPGAKLDAGKAWTYLLRDFRHALKLLAEKGAAQLTIKLHKRLEVLLLEDELDPSEIAASALCALQMHVGNAVRYEPAGKYVYAHGLALLEVAEILTKGCLKYSVRGWKDVPNGVFRYFNAMIRHRLKEAYEDRDADGLLHRACVAWNALAVLELMLCKHAGRELADVLEEQMAAVWAEETTPESRILTPAQMKDVLAPYEEDFEAVIDKVMEEELQHEMRCDFGDGEVDD